MVQGIRAQLPVLVFGLSVAAIYAVALTVVSRLAQFDDPALLAGAVTLDLTLLVPLLYYLLLARPRGWPGLTVLPVFLAGVLIAGWVIPGTQHQVLDLISYGAALAELALVAVIAHRVWQLRRGYREQAASGSDVYESLRQSASAVLGPVAGGVLAYEVAVIYYAVAGWGRSPEPDDGVFSVHRNVAYGAILIALMIAVVVETAAVHLLVRLWSPLLAWVLTALSIYAMVWLIGDFHAVRLRPVQVSDEMLQLRLGLRWTASIPLESIRAVGAPTDDRGVKRSGHLQAVLIGAPNRRIELTQPVRAVGLYGLSRQVATIDLQIDEPARFDEAIADRA